MATTDQSSSSTPADRYQFIRTMAKDMAALAGTGASTTPTPAPKKDEGPVISEVTLPKVEEPFFERPQSRAEREADIPVPLPSVQEASSIVTPAPTAAAIEEDRAAVLARLRKKVSDSAQMSIQPSPTPLTPAPPAPETEKSWPDIPTPPPSFATPEVPAVPPPAPEPVAPPAWENVPAPVPSFSPLSEPVPSRLPPLERAPGKDTYREVVEEVPVPRPEAAPAPDRMHTYTSDFAKRIDTQSASTFSVLAAEQDSATPRTAALPKKRGGGKTVLAIASGLLLIVLAIGGVFMTYQFVMTVRDTPLAVLTVPSIVVADEYQELTGTGSVLMQALAATTGGTLVPGNVIVTYILENTTEEGGGVVSVPAGGDVFLRALEVPAPNIFIRNVAHDSAVGVVNAGEESAPFFALRVDSYERTYAGMLTWEPLLLRDLAALYPLYSTPVPPEETATSTATSTATTTQPEIIDLGPAPALSRFTDSVIANHDVRVLRDTAGRSLVLYGYADKRTLLIVRNEAAFEALLARLKAE